MDSINFLVHCANCALKKSSLMPVDENIFEIHGSYTLACYDENLDEIFGDTNKTILIKSYIFSSL